MEHSTQAQEQSEQTAVIRDVLEHSLAEPNALWSELEAKGIDTTPGVVHQALNMAGDAPVLSVPPHAPGETGGLSADDLILLGALAAKAGGVEHLRRILAVWHETPK